MIKVLIVEDEILARIGLHQLVSWEDMGFSLLEDAKDGKEAIESIHREQPDIILLDLNIPKINGLQLLTYLKERSMEAKVIVISCNEEFDMVKEAMKLGAYDYLRKLNLSPEELKNILVKCKYDLEKVQSAEPRCVNELPFQEIDYDEILNHNSVNVFKYAGTFRTLLCILLPYEANKESAYAVTKLCKEYLGKKEVFFINILKGIRCCYFLLRDCMTGDFYKSFYLFLWEHMGRTIYIGIYEGSMGDKKNIHSGMVLAEQISLTAYYDEKEKIRKYTGEIPCNDHSPQGLLKELSSFKKCLSEFEEKAVYKGIDTIFQLIRDNPYTNINVLRRIFMDMLGVYSEAARDMGGAIEEIYICESNCHYQSIMMMDSLTEIETWFKKFTKLFFERFLISYKCKRSDILKNAFGYINSHLTSQAHLSEAAEYIGISGTYLSTVFKKEMGKNFIEYVNIQKIEQAQKMLKEGGLVYEVSEALGFENCTYFSKVFKRYTNVSPDTYRKQNMKGMAEQ